MTYKDQLDRIIGNEDLIGFKIFVEKEDMDWLCKKQYVRLLIEKNNIPFVKHLFTFEKVESSQISKDCISSIEMANLVVDKFSDRTITHKVVVSLCNCMQVETEDIRKFIIDNNIDITYNKAETQSILHYCIKYCSFDTMLLLTEFIPLRNKNIFGITAQSFLFYSSAFDHLIDMREKLYYIIDNSTIDDIDNMSDVLVNTILPIDIRRKIKIKKMKLLNHHKQEI